MNAPLLPPRASLVVPSLPGDGADDPPSQRHRTIWISDVHLGTSGCKAAFLLDFLKWNDADTIYLVGDIVDGWRLRKGWHWPQAHNDVVQKLLRKARKGTRVVYVPGNHDEFARDFFGHAFGGIELVPEGTGLSQSEFAAALNISPRTLQQWEQGRRLPSGAAETLLRIVARHPEVLRDLA